jgi:Na+/H+-dicarboxylate symporter
MAPDQTALKNINVVHPRNMKYLSEYLQHLVKGRLWLKVLIGMALGLVLGFVLGPTVGWVPPETAAVMGNWLAFPGQLFLAVVQMIVIPLVVASVIRGLAASEDFEQLRKIGSRVVVVFVASTAIAATVGLTVALAINPGKTIDSDALELPRPAADTGAETTEPLQIADLPQRVLTLLPDNPLNAMVESQMLQIIVFAAIFGVALVTMQPERSRPLLDLLGSLQEVCMTIVRWAMLLAPFAVFGLMAQLFMKTGLDVLLGMAVYVVTVILALLIMFALYMTGLFLLIQTSPSQFISASREVLLLAFSTSSSAAVMPLSIKTAQEKLSVRPSIAQFVIPLGATINMNGTALYQAVATVFLAQVYGIDLSLGALVLVVAMAVGASIGSPSTPGVGIVILAMVLGSVGVPAAGIALIMGVDRILDMCRTAINVAGDLVACTLMEQWVGGKKTFYREVVEESQRDQYRAETGSDVIIEIKPEE